MWDYIRKSGFLGMIIDKKYGGKSFSAHGHALGTCSGKAKADTVEESRTRMSKTTASATRIFHFREHL